MPFQNGCLCSAFAFVGLLESIPWIFRLLWRPIHITPLSSARTAHIVAKPELEELGLDRRSAKPDVEELGLDRSSAKPGVKEVGFDDRRTAKPDVEELCFDR